MSLDAADRGKIVQVPLTVRRNQNIDLQFLPEGGNLVAGISGVVGFKAIAEDGKSTPVTGSILDAKGNKVVSFTSVHNGMGSFEFILKPARLILPSLNNLRMQAKPIPYRR